MENATYNPGYKSMENATYNLLCMGCIVGLYSRFSYTENAFDTYLNVLRHAHPCDKNYDWKMDAAFYCFRHN